MPSPKVQQSSRSPAKDGVKYTVLPKCSGRILGCCGAAVQRRHDLADCASVRRVFERPTKRDAVDKCERNVAADAHVCAVLDEILTYLLVLA
jgi:hypothetical protein